MASAPSDPKPILGRVDSDGRLIAADSELERLQVEAGSALGAPVALPQLAAIVRTTQRLKIPVSRRVLAAGRDQDVDMWVRATPDGEEIALVIDRWASRPASSPRLSAVASSGPVRRESATLTWAVDDQLRIIAMAPRLAERLSLDLGAAFGQPLTKLFRFEDNGDGAMPLLAALVSRDSFTGQIAVARDGGSRLMLSGDVVAGEGGEFAGFEGSATFADDSPEGEEPVSPLDGAIHSALRTPLDEIVRSAEQMIDPDSAPAREEYAGYATDIATAARHLLSVIQSIGEEARSESAGRIDLSQLASEAIALVESAARARSIIVGIQPVESCVARGEMRGVIQILVNLIANAVRYSAEGTAVTVSFERLNGSVFVHVADEGPGVPASEQDRIFEPFQQGGVGTEGSGLGLAISRRLARSMGGDIRLRSAPGNGSRFTLILPAG